MSEENRLNEITKELDCLTIDQKKQIYNEFEAILKVVNQKRMFCSLPEITAIVADKFNLSGICAYLAYTDYRTKKHFQKL